MDKKKILLIDDEVKFLEIVQLNLEGTGEYEVMTLADPRNALYSVHSFMPQLILLDLIMPHVGGMEVCEMLNADPLGSKIPIIILSALEKDSDKLHAFKLGVVDYLVKPIDRDELIAAINKALKFK